MSSTGESVTPMAGMVRVSGFDFASTCPTTGTSGVRLVLSVGFGVFGAEVFDEAGVELVDLGVELGVFDAELDDVDGALAEVLDGTEDDSLDAGEVLDDDGATVDASPSMEPAFAEFGAGGGVALLHEPSTNSSAPRPASTALSHICARKRFLRSTGAAWVLIGDPL